MRLSIFDAAGDAPSRTAVIAGDHLLSYTALAVRVERRLGELSAAGALDPNGTRPVALVARPTLATVETLLALFAAGTPALLLHARGTPAEHAALAERAHAVVDPERGQRAPAPALGEFDPERIAAILPTSGSTGTPKLAQLSHRALLAMVAATSAHVGVEDDRSLLSLPLAHVGGLCVLARALGTRRALVLFEPQRSLLGELDRFVTCANEHAVTMVSLVPTLLERLLAPSIAYRPHRALRAVLLGGAGIPRQLVAKARAAGVPVLPTYGLTETCAQVVTGPYTERLAPVGDGPDIFPSGVPIPGTEVRLVDGVVEVRGPTLFSGYLGDAQAQKPDEWLVTRDRGFIDQSGQLVITGRTSDLIITGGENIDPLEVEAALAAIPGVNLSFVYGIADQIFGELVAALVVLDPTHAGLHATLASRLSGRLARYKIPRRIDVVGELPLTPSGKLDRQRARALVQIE